MEEEKEEEGNYISFSTRYLWGREGEVSGEGGGGSTPVASLVVQCIMHTFFA